METGRLRIITHMVRSLPFYFLLALTACHSPLRYPLGGYPYPEHVTGKDTDYYFYPAREKFSRRDSFYNILDYLYFRDMGEPNLSLVPMPSNIFRLFYEGRRADGPTLVIFSSDSIIVKRGHRTKEFSNLPDTSRLDTLERHMVRLLDRYYPIDEIRGDTSIYRLRRRHFLDSLGRRYPQLYSPEYYCSLIDKEYAHTQSLFTYTRQSKKITPADFGRFVDDLNASGFWRRPPKCPNTCEVTDFYGFVLEANTAGRYNVVMECPCEADTDMFEHSVLELVHYAGLDKEFRPVFTSGPDTAKMVIQDVQLEDIKEKPKKKHRHTR